MCLGTVLSLEEIRTASWRAADESPDEQKTPVVIISTVLLCLFIFFFFFFFFVSLLFAIVVSVAMVLIKSLHPTP